MDAIAAAAGVGKGTLFRRFGDRAGLAQALLQEQTRALQEAIIRGPAPLGPGAPPQERLKAMARAQVALMERPRRPDRRRRGRPAGRRFNTGPYTFLRMHVGVLIREADPTADWELLTDVLLGAALGRVVRLLVPRARAADATRILAVFDALIDRLLPA